MKEPELSGRKKLKLVCSFNGSFRPLPPFGQIRYVEGETRIISVDRDCGFLKLRSQVSELCFISNRSFGIGYHVPNSYPLSDASNNDDVKRLVVLANDDDVRRMIEVYDILDLFGKGSRFWIYVCDNVCFDDLNRCSCGCNDGKLNCVKSLTEKTISTPSSRLVIESEGQDLSKYNASKKSFHDLCCDLIKYPQPLTQPSSPSNGDACGIWTSEGSDVEHEFKNIEKTLISKENNMLNDGGCNSMKSRSTRVFGGNPTSRSALRNHRFGLTTARNQGTCPYHVKNHHSNLNEMGRHRNLRGDGRPFVGRYHPGLKPNTNISKLGQPSRLYHRNYWKSLSSSGAHTLKSTMKMTDNQISSAGAQYSMSCDAKKESFLMDIQEYAEFNKQSVDTEAVKSSSTHHNGTAKSGVTSSLERSLQNLSLSISKMENPAFSSIASPDVSEAFLKQQGKPIDRMDEGQMRSGGPVKLSSKFASDAANEKMNEDPSSGLTSEEKVNIQEAQKPSMTISTKIAHDLAPYAQLSTEKLQSIKNSDLECIKVLGHGTYGTVYYGKWRGSDVAVKKIKPSSFTDDSVNENKLVADFWNEAHMLVQLRHPNIVALYGVVTDGPPTNLATVTEYMVNGSLKQVLKKKDRTIDRRKRLIIAMDAAFGMEYLHEKNIVHFDLKSHNFLVNMKDPHRPVCKIGDLGLSKLRSRTLVSGSLRGTIPWMAPELLNSKNNMVTEKVDVYSFGIVMWELLTGEDPYTDLRSEAVIAGIMKGDLRPEIPCWCDPAWRSLMERCWSSDPNSRPSFSEIAKELRAIGATMNIK